MASRKRTHAEDAEQSAAKKRALVDGHGSPSSANGVATDDEPKDDDSLEMFRKEAIYRRMKYYSREHDRSQARVQELERRRSTCEAGLAALEACWTQILGTIRTLIHPEGLPAPGVKPQELYDLTLHVSDDPDPEYLEALKDKMHATSDLVAAFVRMSGQTKGSADSVSKKGQEAQTECVSLRSELSLARAKLRDVESERNSYREQLTAAEKRLDRLQSKQPAASQPQPAKTEAPDESPRETPASPAPPAPAINGVHFVDSSDDLELIRVRDKRIFELEMENERLGHDVAVLKLEMKAPSEDFVKENPYYQVLHDKASQLNHILSVKEAEITSLRAEVKTIQASHEASAREKEAVHEQELQDLRTTITKRENDNLRLREQRDQQLVELNERRREQSKTAVEQWKMLAEKHSERMKVLESENTRLKSRLAAEAGDEDLYSFLVADNATGQGYVDDLKSRLSDSEARFKVLEQSLAALEVDHPDVARHVKAEADARAMLAEAQKQVEKYQAVYGSASSALPPESQKLSQELQRKEEENRRLRLQEQQREQAETALYTELDKLSAAWESLDVQLKSKIFDLTAMEDRVNKSSVEKAKSENKFYSAMRDKEAIENERKVLSRNLEKQARVIEKLSEVEKSLQARVANLDKEIAMWRKAKETMQSALEKLEMSEREWKVRAEGERKRTEEMQQELRDQRKELQRRRTALMSTEDELAKAKKEVERQAVKIKSASHSLSSTSTSREAQLQNEIDKCMKILKCSTCGLNMRNTVITKCMHSFCKSCVDARISTRQRKCPACNLPFGQGEVQQLYFQ